MSSRVKEQESKIHIKVHSGVITFHYTPGITEMDHQLNRKNLN
jgi:hypothetical protein